MQEQAYHSRGSVYDDYCDLTLPLHVNGTGYNYKISRILPHKAKRNYWRLHLSDAVPEGYTEPGLLQPGQFAVYRANEPYIYNAGNGVVVGFYWLHFTGSDVERIVAEAGLVPGTVYTLQEAQMPLLRRNFEELFRELILRRPGWQNMTNCHLMTILTNLGRYRQNQPDISPGSLRMRLEMPIVYMNNHYEEDITVTHLARMVNMSERRFRQLFQEAYGTSPSEYLINLRIRRACSMLRDSAASVTEIAEACGYTDPLYFSRLFRKKMGVSPLAYRKGERATLL